MSISGTTLRDFEFWDEDTKQTVKINLSVRDGVQFKLLEQIRDALRTK